MVSSFNWYRLVSGVTSIVMIFGSFLAANLAQWSACWAILSLCEWAYLIPFHLYWKAVPSDPKTLCLVNGEYNFIICVEHVIGEEKYECEMLNASVMESRRFCGRMCCDVFSGFFFDFFGLYL